jgi:hypothetical protein
MFANVTLPPDFLSASHDDDSSSLFSNGTAPGAEPTDSPSEPSNNSDILDELFGDMSDMPMEQSEPTAPTRAADTFTVDEEGIEDVSQSEDENMSDTTTVYSDTRSELESVDSAINGLERDHHEGGIHGTTMWGVEPHDTETFQQGGTTPRHNVAERVQGVIGTEAAGAHERPDWDDDVDMMDLYNTMRPHRDEYEDERFEWDMEVEEPDGESWEEG